MLVYGDPATRNGDPREALAEVAEALRRAAASTPGIARHGALVAALIEAGELTQGVADAEFAARGGCDARSAAQDAAMALLMRIARSVRDSWEGGFDGPVPDAAETTHALSAAPLPDRISRRRAEGFAFYAVYPEAYLLAAAALGPGPPMRVIGLRSIGAPLGAMVAVGAAAPPPVTLRPVGHPFRRALSIAPPLAAEMLADPTARFAVVDEGPGLSGSSFGAVADFLEDRGVAPARMHFFPSHAGAPGPEACERHRRRWATAARHVVGFDDLVLHAWRPWQRLETWAAPLTGTTDHPLEDISGGAWRSRRCACETAWPPVHAQQERRKFLLRSRDGGTWLLKFVGLGSAGARKLDRARALNAAGFTPPLAGWRHGFLIERWLDEARPVERSGLDRARIAERIGRYLGFRARRFPAGPRDGAPLAALLAMARHNAAQALGEAAARGLDRRWPPAEIGRLERGLRRVETDNRMHGWEWLALRDGRLLKTDALDHHAAHDLVGCQDIAWDVAGAAVEFGLSDAERTILAAALAGEAGRGVEPALLGLMLPCYMAFQLGYHAMAAVMAPPPEARRLHAAAARYADALRRALAAEDGA